jgi:ketosteroid isomerase-like protein
LGSANVDLVRSIYVAWERGDFSAIDWAHPEIEYVIADGPSPGRWTGLPGLAAGARSWLGAWEDFRLEADEFRELDDDRVLVLTRGRGRGRMSGLEVGQLAPQGADVLTICEGKVRSFILYFDLQHASVDLGLSLAAES